MKTAVFAAVESSPLLVTDDRVAAGRYDLWVRRVSSGQLYSMVASETFIKSIVRVTRTVGAVAFCFHTLVIFNAHSGRYERFRLIRWRMFSRTAIERSSGVLPYFHYEHRLFYTDYGPNTYTGEKRIYWDYYKTTVFGCKLLYLQVITRYFNILTLAIFFI